MKKAEKKELYKNLTQLFKVTEISNYFIVSKKISFVNKTGMLWWKKQEEIVKFSCLNGNGEQRSSYNNDGNIKHNPFINPKYYKTKKKAKKAMRVFLKNEFLKHIKSIEQKEKLINTEYILHM